MPDHPILNLIPQRPPFVMVDELLHCDGIITQTAFEVTAANLMVIDGRLCEGGLMENMAQTAAAGAGYMAITENKAVAVGYISAVKNFEVFDLPQIGDHLITEVKIENQVFDTTVVEAMVILGDKVMAKCEMNIFISK